MLKIVFEECENKTSKNIFYLCVVINGLINSADQISTTRQSEDHKTENTTHNFSSPSKFPPLMFSLYIILDAIVIMTVLMPRISKEKIEKCKRSFEKIRLLFSEMWFAKHAYIFKYLILTTG